MRPLPAALIALAALAVTAPLAQADPVTKIALTGFGQWACVEAGASTSVAFTLVDVRTGRVAATQTAMPTGSGCGGGGTSFRADFGNRPYARGDRLTVQPSGAPAVTVDLPYASSDTADAGATSIVRVGGLPATSTVAVGALTPAAVSGARYASPPVPGVSPPVTVTASLAGVAFSAALDVAQSQVLVRSSSVDVRGADPRGGPVHVTVASGGRTATLALAPTRDDLRADLPFELPAGAAVAASQVGWFSHVGRAGTVSLRPGGFTVAIPAGTTGSYSVDALLDDGNAVRAPADPLRCMQLGPSSAVTSACGTPFADRFAATVPLFLGTRDVVSVSETTRAGDVLATGATFPGVEAAFGDAFIDGYVSPTFASPVRMTFRRPAGGGYAAATVSGTPRVTGGGFFVRGEGDELLPLHVTPGTVATFTSPGLARPMRIVLRLTDAVVGTTLVGRTFPGARVRVDHSGAAGTTTRFATASASGAYAVPLTDPQAGDGLSVAALDPVTRGKVEDFRTLGAPATRIGGIHDRQVVRGRIRVTVAAAGASHVLLAAGVLGELGDGAAPFAFALDTRRVADGPIDLFALSSTPAGLEGFDDAWVIVDNTPPHGALPPDAFARVGRRLRLHPGADDANGIASVLVTWGDRTRQRLRGRRATGALAHVYRRAGSFRVRVTITDVAGNRRVVRTVVRAF